MSTNPAVALWQIEEQFWLDGADFYADALAVGALMVLPGPAGVLDRAEAIASIRQAARWQRVSLEDRHVPLQEESTVALVYTARASRGGSAPYVARCSSVYLREAGDWRLALHQQTPLDSREGSGPGGGDDKADAAA